MGQMADYSWHHKAHADLNSIGHYATGDDSLSVPADCYAFYDLWSDKRPSVEAVKKARHVIELCGAVGANARCQPMLSVVHPIASSPESDDLDVMAICFYGRQFKDAQSASWHDSATGDLKVSATGEVCAQVHHNFVFDSDGSGWTPEILEWSVENDDTSIQSAFLKICSYIADAEALCEQSALSPAFK